MRPFLAGALAVAAAAVLTIAPLPVLVHADYAIYDAFLRLAGPLHNSGQVTTVSIDNESLRRVGRWPWPRAKLAELVHLILKSGAKTVALDMMFPEPDKGPVPEGASAKDNDEILAATMHEGRVVAGNYFEFGSAASTPQERCAVYPAPFTVVSADAAPDPLLFQASGEICSVPVLSRAAYANGFLNSGRDSDGTIRSSPLLIRFGDRVYPSLALADVMAQSGVNNLAIQLRWYGSYELQLGPRSIPMQSRGGLLLRFCGSAGALPQISAADVLDGKVPPEALRNKLVILGSSAPGIQDIASTGGAQMTGAELQATVAENLIHGAPLLRPPMASFAEFLLALGIGAAGLFVLVRLSPLPASAAAFLMLGAVWLVTAAVFVSVGWFISPLGCTLAVAGCAAVIAPLRMVSYKGKAEDEIRAWKRRYDSLALAAGNIVYDRARADGGIVWGGGLEKLLGYVPGELNGGLEQWQNLIEPGQRAAIASQYADAIARKSMFEAEYHFRHKKGHNVLLRDTGYPLLDSSGEVERYVGVMIDLTEKKREEAGRARLEEELRQAQKMESIGRLAGGIAHDFNNLLTVIGGYSQLMLGEMNVNHPLRAGLEQVRKSAERAAELTRQLLAFSRKQVIEPRPLNINELIRDSRLMLGRLIGEDVEIVTNLSPEVGFVMADPGQFHQVLMNLVVNARDAMPKGGRLDIRTSLVELDADAAGVHLGVPAGSYAVLTVADSGTGMSEEVRRQIFEPFFTTKGEGKGTGLGLSTVYGIVRQAGGWIEVDSAPDQGATFRIGLPTLADRKADDRADTPITGLEGSETILVVEDQDEVRRFAVLVLRSYGYQALEARGGAEAMAIARSHPGPIQLVLTDVVMPHMTGKDLAAQMKALHPETRVLFMSGYSDERIAPHGVLEPGVDYIQKPYSPAALAQKVRAVLGVRKAKGMG